MYRLEVVKCGEKFSGVDESLSLHRNNMIDVRQLYSLPSLTATLQSCKPLSTAREKHRCLIDNVVNLTKLPSCVAYCSTATTLEIDVYISYFYINML